MVIWPSVWRMYLFNRLLRRYMKCECTHVESGGRAITFAKANPIVTCLMRSGDFPVLTMNVIWITFIYQTKQSVYNVVTSVKICSKLLTVHVLFPISIKQRLRASLKASVFVSFVIIIISPSYLAIKVLCNFNFNFVIITYITCSGSKELKLHKYYVGM